MPREKIPSNLPEKRNGRILMLMIILLILRIPCESQIVTADTLLKLGLEHHDIAMRAWLSGDTMTALAGFKKATDPLRDYQDCMIDRDDSLLSKFRQMTARNPRSPTLNYLTGRLLRRGGSRWLDMEAGERFLKTAIELMPAYPWPYLSLGYRLQEAGMYDSAAQWYQLAITVDSSFELAYENLISTYHQAGDLEDSVWVEQVLMSKMPFSNSGFSRKLKLIRLETDPALRLERYNGLLSGAVKAQQKWSLLQRILSEIPDDRPMMLDSVARTIIELGGVEYRKLRQYAYQRLLGLAIKQGLNSVEDLGREIESTNDPFLLSRIGIYLDTVGYPEKGLPYLEAGYRVSTKENAFNTLIVGLFTDEELESTAMSWRTFLAYRIGSTLVHLDRDDEAEDYLTIAAVGRDSSQIVDAYFELGRLFLRRGNRDRALNWFIQGLAMKGDPQVKAQVAELLGSESDVDGLIRSAQDTKSRTASDFVLLSISGKSVRLSDLRGKIVVLSFWATWCLPCVREFPFLDTLAERYREDQRITSIAITMDESRDSVQSFLSRHPTSREILFSDGTNLEFDVREIPALFLIDPAGNIRYTHRGFDGNGQKFLEMMTSEINQILTLQPESVERGR